MIEDLLIKNIIYNDIILNFSNANKINKQSGEKIIGFGNTNGYYLYWIRKDINKFYFSARIKFNQNLKDNKVTYELTDENKSLILNAMQTIYKAYKNNDTVIIRQIYVPVVSKEYQLSDSLKHYETILEKISNLSEKLTTISEKLLRI